jgi:hypothetical protein
MTRFFNPFVLAAAGLMLASGAAVAGAQINIDFEHLPGPDGVLGTSDDVPTNSVFLQPLGDKFASVGLTFSQGTLFQGAFYDGNPSNHFISSTNPIGVFSVPVFGIAIDSNSYWNAILTAYDVNGNVLATDELLNPNAGSAFLSGQLSLKTLQPIYSFSVLPDNPQRILNLDNLQLTVAEVPEPSQFAMFGLGFAMLGATVGHRAGRRRS